MANYCEVFVCCHLSNKTPSHIVNLLKEMCGMPCASEAVKLGVSKFHVNEFKGLFYDQGSLQGPSFRVFEICSDNSLPVAMWKLYARGSSKYIETIRVFFEIIMPWVVGAFPGDPIGYWVSEEFQIINQVNYNETK